MERIEFLSAVLVVSADADRLAGFYRDVVGLPLETEEHGKLKRHYGCELGDLHFAIHPKENFEEQSVGTGAVRLAFTTFDINALVKKIEEAGHKVAYQPKDTGFAHMTALYDPDGNYVEFTQLSDRWFKHLESRKSKGADVVQRWKSRTLLMATLLLFTSAAHAKTYLCTASAFSGSRLGQFKIMPSPTSGTVGIVLARISRDYYASCRGTEGGEPMQSYLQCQLSTKDCDDDSCVYAEGGVTTDANELFLRDSKHRIELACRAMRQR